MSAIIFFFLMLFIGHPGSSLPLRLSLAVRERLAAGPSCAAGLGLWGTQSSSCSTQPRELWLLDLVALSHVGSSRIKDGTRVPCIGRQILYCPTPREAPFALLM